MSGFKSKLKACGLAVGMTAGLFSVNASAQNIFTGPQEVVSILTNLNGSLIITLGDNSTMPACSTRTTYFLDANTSSGATGIYAMLLTAQVSGQRANLSVDSQNCSTTGFPLVTSARISP